MEDTENELKKCPFCGWDRPCVMDDPAERKTKETEWNYGYETFYVWCKQCGSSTRHFRDMDEAIDAWNLRRDE